MARCFLTGVQFALEDAFVLNRREARLLVAALNNRVASLGRLIEQFSPMDDAPEIPLPVHSRQAGFARKNHRLVCKAVAAALAPGFPEIKLFVDWPLYRSQLRPRPPKASPVQAANVDQAGQTITRKRAGDEVNRQS